MSNKNTEVRFYLDRSKESIITILKSIIANPRLTPEEQYSFLYQLTEHHVEIAQFLSQKLASGENKGVELAQAVVAHAQT